MIEYLASIAPLGIVIVGGTSALLALMAMKRNAEINRQRATLDIIEKSESTAHYRRLHYLFLENMPDPPGETPPTHLIAPQDDRQKRIRRGVIQFLNHYEFIAIGILTESLHEEIYRSWMMHATIRHWNRAAPFIQRERWKKDEATARWYYDPTVYAYYERLVRKWGVGWNLQFTVLNASTSKPPEAATGPGDKRQPRPSRSTGGVAPP